MHASGGEEQKSKAKGKAAKKAVKQQPTQQPAAAGKATVGGSICISVIIFDTSLVRHVSWVRQVSLDCECLQGRTQLLCMLTSVHYTQVFHHVCCIKVMR